MQIDDVISSSIRTKQGISEKIQQKLALFARLCADISKIGYRLRLITMRLRRGPRSAQNLITSGKNVVAPKILVQQKCF